MPPFVVNVTSAVPPLHKILPAVAEIETAEGSGAIVATLVAEHPLASVAMNV